MKRELRDRRMLITGASSGIGRALAEAAAKEGAAVAVAARSAEKLDELAASLNAAGAKVVAVPADVTSAADRQRLLDTAVERLGGLDVLVNNAGLGSHGHFADSTEAIMRQVMEVNFFAPAELMRLAIPLLAQGREPAIVNVASMCGRRGMPAWPEYSASKFALVGLAEALRAELVRWDIAVLTILPGLTGTDWHSHLLRREGKMEINYHEGMAPSYVAEQILAALRKNRGETVLGTEARWILRVNRLLPRLVDRLLGRAVRKLYAQPPRV
jgi:short-subunit dehydrogenase